MTMRCSLFETPEAVALLEQIRSRSLEMQHHRVFGLIRTVEHLQTFMSWHVFAVWDFMSLVKRLQLAFSPVSIPWVPPHSNAIARLINEIVLGEETDEAPGGGHLSHFELYLAAMEEIGADTRSVRMFVDLVAAGVPVKDALKAAHVPSPVQKFVLSTIDVATSGSVEAVLGSFVYGREDAIPDMFRSLLNTWHIDQATAPVFVFYLQRHIELDSDEHGPAAMQMLAEQVGDNRTRLDSVLSSALEAIQQRIALWDALACEFELSSDAVREAISSI